MLSGFSSLLRNNPSLQFRPHHFQLQDQMNAQPFNLSCNFSNREVPKTSLSLDKPANAAKPSSCSFRKNPIPSSSSIATESNSLGGGRRLKRSHHQSYLFEEQLPLSSKRKKTEKDCPGTQFSGSDDEHCIPNNASIFHPRFSSENEVENGLQVKGESSQEEQEGLELVELLTGCVDCIGSSDHTAANYYLTRLGEVASPIGSPIHRVAAYFTEALAIRVAKTWPSIFSIAPHIVDDDDDAVALRLNNIVSPIPKFIHFTLNERLLRATEGKDRIHIIDFDVKQGLQWPSLFQSLASRHNPPAHIRITGIGNYERDLLDTGNRLASIANALSLPYEFHKVIERLEDVRLWMLHVKENECVVVNCIFQLHKAIESQSALMGFLGLIKSTNPSIVLVAEEEAEHNEPRWETRFANALRYYSAIFDSVNYSLPELSSRVRVKIEEMFGRKIRNILGYEGVERVERHEGFDRWRRIMEDGGFQCIGLGEREEAQSRMLLRMYACEDCYSVVKKQGGEAECCCGLTIKWLDQPLFTVSAWAPKSRIG